MGSYFFLVLAESHQRVPNLSFFCIGLVVYVCVYMYMYVYVYVYVHVYVYVLQKL